MTETRAKSGGSGTSTSPVDEGPNKDRSMPAGREAAGGSAPADAPSQPKFTRAPGMAPPPGEPPADGDAPSEPKRQGPPAVAKGSATVPIVTKGKGGAPGGLPGRTGAHQPGRPAAAPPRPGQAPPRPGESTGARRPGGPGGVAGSAAVRAARVSEAVRSARNTV